MSALPSLCPRRLILVSVDLLPFALIGLPELVLKLNDWDISTEGAEYYQLATSNYQLTCERKGLARPRATIKFVLVLKFKLLWLKDEPLGLLLKLQAIA